MNDSKVLAVVLTHNSIKHIDRTLSSLLLSDYNNLDVVVVDHASCDRTPEYVRKNYPTVTCVERCQNPGWASGMNFGTEIARQYGTKYVLWANPDISIYPSAIRLGSRVFDSLPRIGIVGYQEITPGRAASYDLYLQKATEFRRPKLRETSSVSGCCFLVRVSLIDAIGPLDEDYFMHSDEDDFFFRAVMAGYRIGELNIPIWHLHGGSRRKYGLRSSYYAVRSAIRYSIKNAETGGQALSRIARLCAIGCHLRPSPNGGFEYFNLIRPPSLVAASCIWLGAFIWNTIHFQRTLKVRARDHRRAIMHRKTNVILYAKGIPGSVPVDHVKSEQSIG